MQPEDIKDLIQRQIPNSQVEVQMDGNNLHLVVISDAFEGLSPVKKQQMVYAALSEAISQGSIHAVQMKTLTPEQCQQQS